MGHEITFPYPQICNIWVCYNQTVLQHIVGIQSPLVPWTHYTYHHEKQVLCAANKTQHFNRELIINVAHRYIDVEYAGLKISCSSLFLKFVSITASKLW